MLDSRRLRVTLAVVAAGVLAAGISVAVIARSGSTAAVEASPATSAATTAAGQTEPPAAALRAGREFLRVAVLRTDLPRAWELTAPGLRAGYTKERWLTGSIPVVPFPKGDFGEARFRTVRATGDDVLLEVAILPAAGSSLDPQAFYLQLVPVGEHWKVAYWAPRGESPPLPAKPS
jgi:hypothetical protein